MSSFADPHRGSADKTIKQWAGDKCVRTYQNHTDVVRGIVLVPDFGFASCSNSGEIIIYTLEGDLVNTLSGHTSFVYALDVLPNGDLVSSGEDRTVRVWHGGSSLLFLE
jgi:phospholipase A-2-activating protein